MATVRNNLSLRMKGRAGSFSFYSSKGRQIARVSQNSSNYGESARRSEAQQVRRVKWANLVAIYKLTNGSLHGAFETKRTNETDYNAFMRKNLPISSVALTKDMAAKGNCCMQSFLISEGSLPSVGLKKEVIVEDEIFTTNIKCGQGTDYTDATISTLTGDLLQYNTHLKEGMQLSLLVFMPVGSLDAPRVEFERYELTLSLSDTRTVTSVMGGNSVEGTPSSVLSIPTLSTDAYAVMLLSDSTTGRLKVSTETVVQGDSEAEELWSSAAKVSEAMESYGVDASRFLDSGDLV